MLTFWSSAWLALRHGERASHPPSPSSACITCLQSAAPLSCASCFAPLHSESGALVPTISQHPVCAGCEDRSTTFELADEATLYRDRLSTSVTDGLAPPSIASSLRQAWHAAQHADPELAPSFKSLPATVRLHPSDQVLERSVKHPGLDVASWVPVVPSGQATPLLSWRRWVWQAHHSSPLGAHRSADATTALLRRIVWWPHLARDVQSWHDHCVTCAKLRREPRKARQTAVPGSVYDPWQEVVVDMEGPLTPPSIEGHRYIMTYMCNFCGGILLEPVRTLQAAEVRAAFSRCLFRSGTLPVLLRTDRGPEFTNALLGIPHSHGHSSASRHCVPPVRAR